MKSLLLLVLCCTTKLALSKTANYAIEKECNQDFVRTSPEALAYTGTYYPKHDKTCAFGFRLLSNQRAFTFSLQQLVVNNKEGVTVTMKQFKVGEPSQNAKVLWKAQFQNVTDYSYSVNLNSSEDYVQQVFIELMDIHSHHGHGSSSSFNLHLVVTPSYWNVFCRGASLKSSYFLCDSTRECVHGQLLCDGYKNCDGSEDEQSCHTTKPMKGSTNNNRNTSTPAPKPWSTFGFQSTRVSTLNENSFTTSNSNSTVVYVIWWWRSWYVTSMIVISGIFGLILLIGITVCCVQTFTGSSKKNRARTNPTSTSVNSRSTPMQETMQVSVIPSKAYSELPPSYAAVVQGPPAYSQVTVFLDSPCGNSNPI